MTTKSHSALAVGFIVSTSLYSATSFAEEHFRQHDAHVHGQVEFNIAQDGHELLIEITAPGADVVGFEHQPKTAEQQQRLSDATKQLNQANSIFELSSAAQCHIEKTSVNQSIEHDEHDEHAKHDETDKHDNHHGHNESHDANHENSHDGHGAFTVEYHYHCDDLAKLNSITTLWFSQFPNTNTISVNLLTDKAQTAIELSADNAVISL